MQLAPDDQSAQEEMEELQGVFRLIDSQRKGAISEAALAQALLSTMMVDEMRRIAQRTRQPLRLPRSPAASGKPHV